MSLPFERSETRRLELDIQSVVSYIEERLEALIKINRLDTITKREISFFSEKHKESFFWIYNSKLSQMNQLNESKPPEERKIPDEEDFLQEKRKIFERIAREISPFDDLYINNMRAPILVPFTLLSLGREFTAHLMRSSPMFIVKIPKTALERYLGLEDFLKRGGLKEAFKDKLEYYFPTTFQSYILKYSIPFLLRLNYLSNNTLTFDPTQTRELNDPEDTVQKFVDPFFESRIRGIYENIKQNRENNPQFIFQTYEVDSPQRSGKKLIVISKEDGDSFYLYAIEHTPKDLSDPKIVEKIIEPIDDESLGLYPDNSYSLSLIEKDPVFRSLESNGESANDILYFTLKTYLTAQTFNSDSEKIHEYFYGYYIPDYISNTGINVYKSVEEALVVLYNTGDSSFYIKYLIFLNQRFIRPESNPLSFSGTPSTEMKFQTVFEMAVDRIIYHLIIRLSDESSDPFLKFNPNLPSSDPLPPLYFWAILNKFNLSRILLNEISERKFEQVEFVFSIPDPIKDEKTRKRLLMIVKSRTKVKIGNLHGEPDLVDFTRYFLIHSILEKYDTNEKMNRQKSALQETLLCIATVICIYSKVNTAFLDAVRHITHSYWERSSFQEYLETKEEERTNEFAQHVWIFIDEIIWSMAQVILLFYSFNEKSPYVVSPEVNTAMFIKFLRE